MPLENFQDLLQVLNTKPNRPATKADIESFERTQRLSLPPELGSIYSVCNGCKEDRRLRFVPLSESARYIGIYPSFGLLALTDSNDSNPYCVACLPPLQGYVIRLCHDGESRVEFRSIQSFVDRLLILVSGEKWRIDDLFPEIKNDDDARTERDFRAGQELLTVARPGDSYDGNTERLFAILNGMSLLPANHLNTIAAFLEDGDNYVREAARERLRGLNTPEALARLAQYCDVLQEFQNRVIQAMKRSKINVSEIKQNTLILAASGQVTNLDIEMFYDRRNEPGIEESLVTLVKGWLSKK